MKKTLYILIFAILIFSCSISEEEADSAYQNAKEYSKQISKNENKREDALFFYLKASQHNKYKNRDVAEQIYVNASILLSNRGKNIDYDTKKRYEENIISGIEVLIEASQNNEIPASERLKVQENAKKILSSNSIISKTIINVLNDKNENLLNLLKQL